MAPIKRKKHTSKPYYLDEKPVGAGLYGLSVLHCTSVGWTMMHKATVKYITGVSAKELCQYN